MKKYCHTCEKDSVWSDYEFCPHCEQPLKKQSNKVFIAVVLFGPCVDSIEVCKTKASAKKWLLNWCKNVWKAYSDHLPEMPEDNKIIKEFFKRCESTHTYKIIEKEIY